MGLNGDCDPTGDPAEGGEVESCITFACWHLSGRGSFVQPDLHVLTMLKQLEKDSGEKTKGAVQGR